MIGANRKAIEIGKLERQVADLEEQTRLER